MSKFIQHVCFAISLADFGVQFHELQIINGNHLRCRLRDLLCRFPRLNLHSRWLRRNFLGSGSEEFNLREFHCADRLQSRNLDNESFSRKLRSRDEKSRPCRERHQPKQVNRAGNDNRWSEMFVSKSNHVPLIISTRGFRVGRRLLIGIHGLLFSIQHLVFGCPSNSNAAMHELSKISHKQAGL